MPLSERDIELVLYNRAPREKWLSFEDVKNVIEQWCHFEQEDSWLCSVENPIPVWVRTLKCALKNLERDGRSLYKTDEQEYLFIDDLHKEFEQLTADLYRVNLSFEKALPVFINKIKIIADNYFTTASIIFERYMHWYSAKR